MFCYNPRDEILRPECKGVMGMISRYYICYPVSFLHLSDNENNGDFLPSEGLLADTLSYSRATCVRI